ncbi:MAG: VWA-like domain-containing protein [Pseudomonadota bacterium]
MVPRHSTRAARALRKLAEEDPAFAMLSLWCQHRDGEADALAVSDDTTITYGPAFGALSLAEQMATAGHHILHIALRHAARARGFKTRFGQAFDAETYNIAADAVTNEVLVTAGYTLPRPFVALDGVLKAGALKEAPDIAQWDADRLYVRLMAKRSGQGEGGKLKAYAQSRGFTEDMRPAGAESVGGEAEADWQERLSRALDAGRIAGRGIGVLGHRIADAPKPRTPWEVILRGLLTKAVTPQPRLSYARPSRQWIARQTGEDAVPFEPGQIRDRRIPRIAVGLDVSTSIDAERLRLFAAQIAGIGRRTGAEVQVLVFDEGVRSQRQMAGVSWEEEITALDLAEGGGTSFVEVMDQAAALDPSAIVILTDLDGPFGKPPRAVPVIWAVPDDPAEQPPFGRVLSLA